MTFGTLLIDSRRLLPKQIGNSRNPVFWFYFSLLSLFLQGIARMNAKRRRQTEKEREIAQAKRLSADANERSAKLELAAEQARSEQKRLEAEPEKSRLEQEQIKTQNLILQSTVEKERIKRLELEKQVGFRSISTEQADKLIASLRESGRNKVIIKLQIVRPSPLNLLRG